MATPEGWVFFISKMMLNMQYGRLAHLGILPCGMKKVGQGKFQKEMCNAGFDGRTDTFSVKSVFLPRSALSLADGARA